MQIFLQNIWTFVRQILQLVTKFYHLYFNTALKTKKNNFFDCTDSKTDQKTCIWNTLNNCREFHAKPLNHF